MNSALPLYRTMDRTNSTVRRAQLDVKEAEMLGELKRALHCLLGGRLHRLAVFGSRARGDAEPDSDIDVAVLVNGLDRELKRTILDVVADVELAHEIALSTVVLSTEEFASLLNRERRIARDIEEEGLVL